MVDKVKELVNQITSGDNVEAGETFKYVMQDNQLDAIDLKKVEVQLDWMSGEAEQPNEE